MFGPNYPPDPIMLEGLVNGNSVKNSSNGITLCLPKMIHFLLIQQYTYGGTKLDHRGNCFVITRPNFSENDPSSLNLKLVTNFVTHQFDGKKII